MDTNNIKEMRNFDKQLVISTQKQPKDGEQKDSNESTSNTTEPKQSNNNTNLDISSVKDKEYYTPPKEPVRKNKTKPTPNDKLDYMLSDVNNHPSNNVENPALPEQSKKNLTQKDKLDYILEDTKKDKIAKVTMAKAATGNPIAMVKVANQLRKKKKRKKKKRKKAILIVFTLFLSIPIYILGTTIPTFLIMVAINDSSNALLDAKDVVANKYAKKYMDEEAIRKIPQKYKSDKDSDPDLDKMVEDATKSDLYTTPTTSKVPYFSQHDPRWKDLDYCPGENYSLSACAPTTLAMILTHIGYTNLDSDGDGVTLPTDTGSYSLSKGYATTAGTLPGLFLDLKDVNADYYTPNDIAKVKEILAKGEPVAYSVIGSSTFASNHLLVATGFKDNKFTVNDPNSVKLTEQTFTEAEFMIGANYFVHIHK